jgi:triosephosphate isomerase
MWKALQFFSRIFMGATFIFSGFVKAVDPVGGAIKFHDYFQAFHMEWLMPLNMPFSIALASLEFTIGILLFFNVFPRKTAIISFLFMVFFTLLTLVLAIFNPVSDCGCFGDAIKLTNWQTFWKNIVIMVFAAYLFWKRNELKSPYSIHIQRLFSTLMLIYIIGIAFYSLRHLPLLDFRPYAIGKHIPSGMEIPEDAPPPEYKTTFILEKDGIRKEFTEDNYPYEDTTWTFIESKTKLVREGYRPPIYDFVLQHAEEGDITDRLMNMKKPLFLVVSPSVTEIKEKTALRLAGIQQTARENHSDFYVVTASPLEEAEKINALYKTNFPFLQGDETNLKTIIRSNPGLLLIINGTVAGKWHYNDLPPASEMKQPLSFALTQQQNKKERLIILGHAVLLVLLAAIILKSSKTIKQ